MRTDDKEANKELGKVDVIRCTCKNKYMDKKYGKQMRVHNKSKKGPRCCVCKKEK